MTNKLFVRKIDNSISPNYQENQIELRVFLAVFWRISDRKSTFIGSLWLDWRTIVRYSPGSFMTGKFVGEIENTIWQN